MPDMQADSERAMVAPEPAGTGPGPDVGAVDDQGALAEEVSVADAAADSAVPCAYISGSAGTGKTFQQRQLIEADPTYGVLVATTGISAVNLGATTINSTLGYFDTASMRDAYLVGSLQRKLKRLAAECRRIVVDEVSMMDAEQLTLLYTAVQQVNAERGSDVPPFGITLTGDFAQLPPVKAEFAFRSPVWPEFAAHTTRLTKVWRQADAQFLAALNAARAGDGAQSAAILDHLGVEWHSSLDITFDGTTLIPRNEQVDRFNAVCLAKLHTPAITVPSRGWGKQDAGWKNVPPALALKVGAYVMLLANAKADPDEPDGGGFRYVNGDCGHLVAWDPTRREAIVRLVRTDAEVRVPMLTRSRGDRSKPDGWPATSPRQDGSGWMPRPHYQRSGRLYCDGQCEFLPLRLAWASTVHKSQGLSLDKVQIDIRDHFFGSPGMAYVALSRCRTMEGLRLVGQRERYVSQVKVNPQVAEWL